MAASNSTNPVVANAMNACAKNAQFNVGDKVVCTTGIYKGVKGTITEIQSGSDMVRVKEDKYGQEPFWDAKDIKLANACDTARNAGIWESTEEAEDRSDVFVRAALGRTKYNFDGEAQTLREVIKLLASAEQTPKIKKNTEKLKGILSRVEKAAVLFRGI